MVDKNDEFWKELMGEDFKVDLNAPKTPPRAEQKPEPKAEPKPAARQETSPGEGNPFIDSSLDDRSRRRAPEDRGAQPAEGFTIEYIKNNAQPQRPVQPVQRSQQPPVQRPQPVQETQQQRGQGPGQEDWLSVLQSMQGQRPAAPQDTASQETRVFTPAEDTPQETRRFTPAEPQVPPRRPAPQEPVYDEDEDEDYDDYGDGYDEGRGRGLFRRRRKDPLDKFEVEFDFDSEYADVDEKAIRRGRTKRTGCLSGVLMFILIMCVSVVLACMGWTWATDVLGLDGEDQQVEVTIPKDIFHTEMREEEDDEGQTVEVEVSVADMDAVAEELYQKGLVRYRWLFKLFSQIAHGDTKVEPGTYTLNMNFDYRALIHGMTAKSGTRNIVTLTIPEGYTITQIVKLMEENKVCGSEELLDSLANTDFDYDFLDKSTLGDPKRLEGYLFPDTYEFYEGDDPDAVIKRFLNNFKKKWDENAEEFDAKAQELGYSQREILTIASLIEKEAGIDAERDSIASVIYNRLKHPDRQGTNGFLQIDATIYYVIADTGEDFSTDTDDPYNTYRYTGLPPGPIANPGLASIRAALNPAESDYYYYALGLNKSHRFFKTYDEFHAFVISDQYGG